jgi:alpha-L-fucosidase
LGSIALSLLSSHPGGVEHAKEADFGAEMSGIARPLYLEYMQLQLSELLTKYGPVALIWFDGLSNQEKYDGRRFVDLIHRLQPRTLFNDRLGVPGDYQPPEQFIPSGIPTTGIRFNAVDTSVQQKLNSTVPKEEDFQLGETCMTINNTWAYKTNDHEFKSAQFLIRSLVEVASRGGNFLLNVGPQPNGQIQPEFQSACVRSANGSLGTVSQSTAQRMGRFKGYPQYVQLPSQTGSSSTFSTGRVRRWSLVT